MDFVTAHNPKSNRKKNHSWAAAKMSSPRQVGAILSSGSHRNITKPNGEPSHTLGKGLYFERSCLNGLVRPVQQPVQVTKRVQNRYLTCSYGCSRAPKDLLDPSGHAGAPGDACAPRLGEPHHPSQDHHGSLNFITDIFVMVD